MDFIRFIKSPQSFMYVLLTYMLSRDNNSFLPEALYIFDIKDIVKFLKVFGGRKINVPSPDEFIYAVKTVIAGYLLYVEKLPEEDVKDILNISGYSLRYVREHWNEWKTFLDKNGYLNLQAIMKLNPKKGEVEFLERLEKVLGDKV